MIRLTLIISIFLAGCATRYSQLGTSLAELQPKLLGAYNFSFLYKGDKYFFAPKSFKQGNRKCYLYLGFKNEKLAYAFSNRIFRSIEKTYAESDSPEDIKKGIVEKIANEHATPNRCFDLGHGPPPDAGQGVGVFILLYPITVPLSAYYIVEDQLDKKLLQNISNQVYLGMAKNKVPKFIQKKWQKRTKGEYYYYEYLQRNLKMILYFKNSKLDAWSQIYIKNI